MDLNGKRQMLLHFLGALAYRTQKALRGAGPDFENFEAGNRTRTPMELVRHMTSVLGYARTFFIGGSYPRPEPVDTMDAEVARFHAMLEDLGRHIRNGSPMLNGMTEEQMLQGPFSDAMTHGGQIAMLRRLAGDPVAPENFIVANISGEQLSQHQPEPASPDAEWPEAPRLK